MKREKKEGDGVGGAGEGEQPGEEVSGGGRRRQGGAGPEGLASNYSNSA